MTVHCWLTTCCYGLKSTTLQQISAVPRASFMKMHRPAGIFRPSQGRQGRLAHHSHTLPSWAAGRAGTYTNIHPAHPVPLCSSLSISCHLQTSLISGYNECSRLSWDFILSIPQMRGDQASAQRGEYSPGRPFTCMYPFL